MAFLKTLSDVGLNNTCTSKPMSYNDAILDSCSDSDSLLFYKSAASAMFSKTYVLFLDYALVVILTVFIILFIYVMYKTFWDPICYIKELTEVGFEHIPAGADRERRISRAQATRRAGTKVPPPFPNGWFVVAESRDLRVGDVTSVDALGQNFCVYRGSDGVARVVDAYCPHLGANLGVGGRVCGAGGVQCPFHEWQFDADGRCVHVPGGDAPKGVSIKTWPCVEADAAIWVWYDAENRPPRWELANAPECQVWGYRGRNEFMVSAHIQEIPENGADVAHLNAVHSLSMISELGEKYPILNELIGRHIWAASWKSNDDHTSSISLTHDYRMFNTDFFHVNLNITQIGPGHVRLLMQTPIGPFLLSQSVTPLGPLLQRVVHRVFSPVYNAPAAIPLIIGEGKMIERDIRIWNHKRFVSAPTYVRTDRTIRAFRHWYSQFYSACSVSYRDALTGPLDW